MLIFIQLDAPKKKKAYISSFAECILDFYVLIAIR